MRRKFFWVRNALLEQSELFFLPLRCRRTWRISLAYEYMTVPKLQTRSDIRLLYRTFPSKWNNAKLCSLWLANLRSATESFEPLFLPFLAGLVAREDSCSSIIAPLMSPREHVTIMSSTFFVRQCEGLPWKCLSAIACKTFIINVGATGLKLQEFGYPLNRLFHVSPT